MTSTSSTSSEELKSKHDKPIEGSNPFVPSSSARVPSELEEFLLSFPSFSVYRSVSKSFKQAGKCTAVDGIFVLPEEMTYHYLADEYHHIDHWKERYLVLFAIGTIKSKSYSIWEEKCGCGKIKKAHRYIKSTKHTQYLLTSIIDKSTGGCVYFSKDKLSSSFDPQSLEPSDSMKQIKHIATVNMEEYLEKVKTLSGSLSFTPSYLYYSKKYFVGSLVDVLVPIISKSMEMIRMKAEMERSHKIIQQEQLKIALIKIKEAEENKIVKEDKKTEEKKTEPTYKLTFTEPPKHGVLFAFQSKEIKDDVGKLPLTSLSSERSVDVKGSFADPEGDEEHSWVELFTKYQTNLNNSFPIEEVMLQRTGSKEEDEEKKKLRKRLFTRLNTAMEKALIDQLLVSSEEEKKLIRNGFNTRISECKEEDLLRALDNVPHFQVEEDEGYGFYQSSNRPGVWIPEPEFFEKNQMRKEEGKKMLASIIEEYGEEAVRKVLTEDNSSYFKRLLNHDVIKNLMK